MDKLIAADQDLFLFLNGLHADWLDPIMVFISGKLEWIPLYVFILFLAYRKMGLRGVVTLLALAGLGVLFSDRLSVMAFKNVFERFRPCHEPSLSGLVHIVSNKCGGKFGFVSSHATNHMSLAIIMISYFKEWHYRWKILLLLWAIVVGYSRIYLGVHYPGDVLGGFILGFVIAKAIFWIINFWDLTIINPVKK